MRAIGFLAEMEAVREQRFSMVKVHMIMKFDAGCL